MIGLDGFMECERSRPRGWALASTERETAQESRELAVVSFGPLARAMLGALLLALAAGTEPECKDEHSNCASWADGGECEKSERPTLHSHLGSATW